MYYVGVDLHKKTSWFCILDSNGKKIKDKNVNNEIEELKKFIKKIPKPFSVAVESTCNWYFFIDLIESSAEKVYLANPYSLKAFAKQHKKNDKIEIERDSPQKGTG